MSYSYAVYAAYDDLLDGCYPDITVFGVGRLPSTVCKLVDPIMYEMGLAEWLDELQTEGNWCDTCECFIRDYSHLNGPFMSACNCGEDEEEEGK